MLLFLLGLVVSVPLAVIANLATPRIQTAVANRSLKRKEKRITKIRAEVAEIEKYREGTHGELLALCAHRIIYTILQFSLLVIVNVTIMIGLETGSPIANGIELNIVAGLAVAVTFYLVAEAQRTMFFFRRIYRFEKYLKATAEDLAKLGVTEANHEIEQNGAVS